MNKIRTIIIGFGYRGRYLYELLRQMPDFEIIGIADPAVREVDGITVYNDGPDDYLRLLDDSRPELAVIASPWRFHISQAEACISRGCNVAIEIKCGLERGEYEHLAELEESTGKKVFPMENALFFRDVLAVKEMADKGVFGTIMHMRGGYRHDIRDIIVDKNGVLGGDLVGEGAWRSGYYTSHNGDIYPTHGFAPLCMIAGINRTDHIRTLASFASGSKGIESYVCQHGGRLESKVTMGDVVSTEMTTEKGVLITLTHDTTLPRPKGFDFEVQGTKGIWDWEGHRIFIEGLSENWEDDKKYIDRYEDKYWREYGDDARIIDYHHLGMDYIMLMAIRDGISGKYEYPATILDMALWTSVSVLSVRSILEGSANMCF